MRPYVAPVMNTTHLVTSRIRNVLAGTNAVSRYDSGPLAQKGDHRSRTLRVVCIACNSGWMSTPQKKAQQILVRLLESGCPRVLQREAQSVIASWATMFTMVYEFADKPTIAISQAQREFFKAHQTTPVNWMIWVSTFSGTMHSLRTHHRGITGGRWCSDGNTIELDGNCETQITSGVAGKFVFLTFHAADDALSMPAPLL